MHSWKSAVNRVLDDWHGGPIITSPDVDGMLSAAILRAAYPTARIAGFYTTTWLVLFKGNDLEDAQDSLWLDHDISAPGVRCIGQHLINLDSTDTLNRRHDVSFNPNQFFGQTFKTSFRGKSGKSRDKYPYSTANLLHAALGRPDPQPTSFEMALFAHADGVWATQFDYPTNCGIWADLMFPDDQSIDFLRNEFNDHPSTLKIHANLVQRLLQRGVSTRTSRVADRGGLPEARRDLIGHQSISGQVRGLHTNAIELFTRRFVDCYAYIAEVVDSPPDVDAEGHAGNAIKGSVSTPYPERIDDLDLFMESNQVFSHAITNRRTLRFTTGIDLDKPGLTNL